MPEPGSACPDARFWSGRRVLVTGHTGFKGAWLSLWLSRAGRTGLGLRERRPDRARRSTSSPASASTSSTSTATSATAERVAEAIGRLRPEVVLHLAAQPIVRRSFRDPVETYATNVMGTVNVLDAVRRAGGDVRVAIVVSSDKCYENREWVWGYRENEPMGGHDPYSSSKGCAELVTAAYRALVLRRRRRARRRQRAGRQRLRRRRLGRGPPAARRLPRAPWPATRSASATPTRSAPGSTCSTP